MRIQPLTGKWQFHQVGAEEWLPANIPGSVHADLMASGRIPDPFTADNEKRVQWVAESDWTYQNSFTCTDELLSEEKVFLVFIDTVRLQFAFKRTGRGFSPRIIVG